MLLGNEKASLLGSITGSITTHVGKTVSHVSKAMGKLSLLSKHIFITYITCDLFLVICYRQQIA